jgi:hypothetical protein
MASTAVCTICVRVICICDVADMWLPVCVICICDVADTWLPAGHDGACLLLMRLLLLILFRLDFGWMDCYVSLLMLCMFVVECVGACTNV